MFLLSKILARLSSLSLFRQLYLLGLVEGRYTYGMSVSEILAEISAKLEKSSTEILLKCWDFIESQPTVKEEEIDPEIFDDESESESASDQDHESWQEWIDSYLSKDRPSNVVRDLKKCRENINLHNNMLFSWACRENHAHLVKLLLSHDKIDPTLFGNLGIYQASDYNAVDVVKLLLNDYRVSETLDIHDLLTKVKDEYKRPEVEKILTEFIKLTEDVPEPWQEWIDTYLEQHEQDLPDDLIRDLKECRKDVNFKNNLLFRWACRENYAVLANMLLDVPGATITKGNVWRFLGLCYKRRDLEDAVYNIQTKILRYPIKNYIRK